MMKGRMDAATQKIKEKIDAYTRIQNQDEAKSANIFNPISRALR